MAIVHPQSQPAPATQPTSAQARALCEDRKYRARLRQYAHAGGLTRSLNVLVDSVDLTLSVAGYIERVPPRNFDQSTVAYRITREGEVRLFDWTQQRREQNAPHHCLGSDLAQWLRSARKRITWENVQFEFDNGGTGVLRPDVYSLVPTLNAARMAPQVFEVKVSRSDFLRDVALPSKRESYFQMAPQVFYAAPAGLLSRTEVPPECGLMENHGPGIWKVARPAPKRKAWAGLTSRQWLALVLKPHQSQAEPSCPDPTSPL